MTELTEYDPAVAPPPLKVVASSWWPIIGIALRQIGLIGGAITTLFNYYSAHDIRGIFDYIGGSEFLLVLGVTVTLSIAAYGYIREWFAHHKLVFIARAAPDDVVIVKEKETK